MKENKLWYDKPAHKWLEALPLGNGRLGMMVYGGVSEERIQINEETVWSGWECEEFDNPKNLEHLEESRKLIFEGKYSEASELCRKYHICRGKGHNEKEGFGSYQTAGELYITIPNATDGEYYRDLKIDEGLATVCCESSQRLYFISPKYNTAVIKIMGNVDGVALRYERERTMVIDEDNEIIAIGHLPTKFVVLIRKEISDGEITIYITAATDYKTDRDPIETCRNTLDSAMSAGYDTLLEDTKNTFEELMGRIDISLTASEERKALPTDARLAEPDKDIGLVELYFNYGRYLLIGSSFKAKLPANLQGIWCEDYNAPWASDYHLDINAQMNYWMAEVCDLPELTKPFFELIKTMVEHGKKTASISYGCPGWVAHMTTNPWGYTALGQAPIFGAFVSGGAWCLRHVKERWRYSKDKSVLVEMYPALKGASEFFCAYLVTDPRNGYLVTAPATSPENAFFDPDSAQKACVSAGPTMDMSIIKEILEFNIEAASVLGVDSEFAERLKNIISKLPPLRIGKHGQIMEWSEDFDEPDPGHRHISHLYSLYPADRINQSTPELFDAARKTVERRLSYGGGHTGWSRAWLINLYARLRDGNMAYENITALLKQSTQINLFDNCGFKGTKIFQIDGNLGTPAGIAEMLIQSHDGYIDILPALPNAWDSGEFRDLMARGGFKVSAKWENGHVTWCRVTGDENAQFDVKINDRLISAVGNYEFKA